MNTPQRTVQFGYFPVPDASDPAQLVAYVRRAEALGFDLIGVQDHPYQRRFLDAFTLLAWLAAATERVRLFTDVAHLPLRPLGVRYDAEVAAEQA